MSERRQDGTYIIRVPAVFTADDFRVRPASTVERARAHRLTYRQEQAWHLRMRYGTPEEQEAIERAMDCALFWAMRRLGLRPARQRDRSRALGSWPTSELREDRHVGVEPGGRNGLMAEALELQGGEDRRRPIILRLQYLQCDQVDVKGLEGLKAILAEWPGPCEVVLELYFDRVGPPRRLLLPMRIAPLPGLRAALAGWSRTWEVG